MGLDDQRFVYIYYHFDQLQKSQIILLYREFYVQK